MGPCNVLTMGRNAVSIARAFEARGVALQFPARSRSGVRGDDGMVVFALPVARVRVDGWGCSCLLWAVKDDGVDDALGERVRHCRLAVRHGCAEGFLLGRDNAPLECRELLALRVVEVRREYWARWGGVTRVEQVRTWARASSATCQ
jgi:hypothetical protein